MKFIKQILPIITIISLICLPYQIECNDNNTQSKTVYVKGDINAIWSDLFTQTNRPSNCVKLETGKEDDKNNNSMIPQDSSLTISIPPRKKFDKYSPQMIGWGSSSYLFDYLDQTLQGPITKQFEKVFEKAFDIVPKDDYKDPYSLESILGMKGSDKELLNQIQKLNDKFDVNIWEKSISVSKMKEFIEQNKWFTRSEITDYAKYIVDEYDFNGDGRLSRKEFIIADIINNKSLLGTEGTCEMCFNKLASELIDPIFLYIDNPKNRNLISSKNIWDRLMSLRRKKPQNCNIYDCKNLEGYVYRTNSINDFVMKSSKTKNGKLNKLEFRLGILQGYWSRHVKDDGIYEKDQMNQKSFRWGPNENVDLVCAKMFSQSKINTNQN